MSMGRIRTSRVKAGVCTAAVLLSGFGVGLAAAAPAAAYAGYCNAQVTKSRPAASGGKYNAYLPAYGTNINCYMNPGAQSNAVKALQKNLNWCYGRKLTVDGIFGNDTRDALEYAQGEEDISADGGYGEQSRTHLQWRWYENRNLWYCGRLKSNGT
ncbi:peptidoglycan-binding protein [Streptomyces sp. NPDC050418]|uniref:peptidoglycan-binding protein n=1 Tax=Streptomyces sp. NPDC050418 TaxID=3365612 RepID=UPI00378DBA30